MSAQLHIDHRSCPAPVGRSLFELAEGAGVHVPSSCARQGRCKECVVEVTAGMERLTPPTADEAHLAESYRLACCARVAAEEGEIHCHTMRRGTMRIERDAADLPTTGASTALDPAVTREGDRVLLEGVEIDRRAGPLHGLAIDIGTTTVVLRLVNLETGDVVADASFENPQRFGGSDVMARIHFDSVDRTHALQRALLGYLSRTIQEFPVDPQSIYEVVIAGNSTMRDLFFGLSVHPIGQSPYQSITEIEVAAGRRASTSVSVTADHLRLPIHPRARVYGLPIISGHVGADAAACLLAIDLAHEERVVAMMDIGTNTELLLGNRHKIFAASCPAGPAFEGGQIAFGMPALPGAIEEVRMNEDGTFAISVIDNAPPDGLCGSGLVDLLSELQRTDRINPIGRYTDGARQIVVSNAGERPVTFSEADINALAQAKGANVAGLRIVAGDYGVSFADIEIFYVAGGFGRHLNLDSARRIGLIPDIPDARIRQIGNASIEGAMRALLSRTRRAELEEIVKRVSHRRLETHPQFFDIFVEGCLFQPVSATA
ncbi:ferredoxin [Opitutus sp. ER46]|nr:ferredoxin [Opitutus sp. ER46]